MSLLYLTLMATTFFAGDPSAPTIEFLDVEEGRRAFGDDRAEPYFEHMRRLEIRAKSQTLHQAPSLAVIRSACRSTFVLAVQEFTDAEKAAVSEFVTALHPTLARRFPAVARLPWRFIKVAEHIEGGLPHTRGDCIILPANAVTQLVALSASTEEKARLSGQVVMAHEQLHVLQRARPKLFEDLYTHVWGLERVDRIDSCEFLTARQMLNPDGVDTRWIFAYERDGQKRYIWPLLYSSVVEGTPRIPQDFATHGIKVEPVAPGHYRVVTDDAGRPMIRPLNSIGPYMAKFCGVRSNVYHPNEASAHLFSQLVAAYATDSLSHADQRRQFLEMCEPTAAWFTRNLK